MSLKLIYNPDHKGWDVYGGIVGIAVIIFVVWVFS